MKENFIKNGFCHELLRREGNIAIYKRFKKEHSSPHYEVIKITPHNGYTIAGKNFPPGESYPSSSEWGTKGFTYYCANEAESKFNQLKGEHYAKTKR